MWIWTILHLYTFCSSTWDLTTVCSFCWACGKASQQAKHRYILVSLGCFLWLSWAGPQFWDLPQSQVLARNCILLVPHTGQAGELVLPVLRFNCLLLFPCHAGSLGILLKAAYISVSLHNVAGPLGVGSLPGGLLNPGPHSELLGQSPASASFTRPPQTREFRGTSSFLSLQAVNRDFLSPGGLGFCKTKTKACGLPWFLLYCVPLLHEWRSDLVVEWGRQKRLFWGKEEKWRIEEE